MIKKDDFNPRILELFLNSNYLERKELYKNIKLLAQNFEGKILDLGCGTKPYEKLFVNSDEYIGLEVKGGVLMTLIYFMMVTNFLLVIKNLIVW